MRCAGMVLAVGLCVLAGADEAGLEAMTKPAYTEDGKLVLPKGYRSWVFVGSSLGLNYSAQEPEGPGVFHHVYIQPEAYRHYAETGEFPEKTILVMENYSAGSKENNTAKGTVEGEKEFENLNGHFQDKRVGVEVALKDSEQFEDRWAYFNFSTRDGVRETAPAFPKAICWDCHRDHAADDNVFIQFYPVLREHYELRKSREAAEPRGD
jgi:hypothetical protein